MIIDLSIRLRQLRLDKHIHTIRVKSATQSKIIFMGTKVCK